MANYDEIYEELITTLGKTEEEARDALKTAKHECIEAYLVARGVPESMRYGLLRGITLNFSKTGSYGIDNKIGIRVVYTPSKRERNVMSRIINMFFHG